MATGSVPITAGSGTPIRVISNTGVDSGAYQQVMSLAGSDGQIMPTDPDGTLQVSQDSKALFLDAFDGTLGSHTTGGTAPSISGGQVSFASSTTASASSYMRTTLGFVLRPQAYLRAGHFVQLGETTTSITNSTRWWGYGQNQSTPTAANPVLNGAVFVVDYQDGALYGAVYSAGTRTQRIALTRPTDGAFHKYEVWFRQAIVYFVIDGQPVGSISLPNTAVTSGMYLIAGSTNFTTGPSTAPVLRLSSASMADTSGTVNTIGDGVNPTVQATVKGPNAGAALNADSALAVSIRDMPALASGTSQIGWLWLGGTNPSGSYYTSTTTNAATVAKTSAGSVQALSISNTSGSQQFVKLYNATSVTLGTTAAIIDIPVAAGANLTLPIGVNGLRFTTGIAFAVTGAIGATNNTAGAGGVLIAMTYV